MNKLLQDVRSVSAQVSKILIENKILAKKNFELIVRNTLLTGENIELKKKYEASKELNKRLLETNTIQR